jgi:hypothetical protein
MEVDFFHWKLSKSVLFVENGPANEAEIRTEKKWFLAFVPLPVMSIIFLGRGRGGCNRSSCKHK